MIVYELVIANATGEIVYGTASANVYTKQRAGAIVYDEPHCIPDRLSSESVYMSVIPKPATVTTCPTVAAFKAPYKRHAVTLYRLGYHNT